uniref:Uncharacterized protein n=1 Tax=Trichogramma kaykai TaxID=54128 RepID=A0ABD2WCP1_9HYME
MAGCQKNNEYFQIRVYDSLIRDLEEKQKQQPPIQLQSPQHQQPRGTTLENWDASEYLAYIPKRGPAIRSKADKRRARRERRRLYGCGQQQRPKSPEPGRPIPDQKQLENDMGWLEDYIKNREAKRAEEPASNTGPIINIVL